MARLPHARLSVHVGRPPQGFFFLSVSAALLKQGRSLLISGQCERKHSELDFHLVDTLTLSWLGMTWVLFDVLTPLAWKLGKHRLLPLKHSSALYEAAGNFAGLRQSWLGGLSGCGAYYQHLKKPPLWSCACGFQVIFLSSAAITFCRKAPCVVGKSTPDNGGPIHHHGFLASTSRVLIWPTP